MSTGSKVRTAIKVSKVDADLGIVIGWAIVCTRDGEDYYDLQGHHIPESVMLKAVLDFNENSRVAKEMHAGEARGSVDLVAITSDIAASLGFVTKQTGAYAVMRPDAAMLAKFASGELNEFSIGGVGSLVDVAEAV